MNHKIDLKETYEFISNYIVVMVPSSPTLPTLPIPIPNQDSCNNDNDSISSSNLSSNSSSYSSSPKLKKKKKNRCLVCNKKVGLLGFSCNCEGLYCAAHRHAEQHNCSYDFKRRGLNILEKNLTKVEADKVHNRL